MQMQIVTHPGLQLVGLKTRTSNAKEMNTNTANIGALIGRYFSEDIASQISARQQPGVNIVGYTNYESDEYGEYDYYFGEAVTSLPSNLTNLASLTVPAGKYLKITSDKGEKMTVIIATWQHIWQLTKNKKLGATRTYQADFEVYDERAHDPNNMVFDIYLSIK